MKIAMFTNNYKPFIGGVPISVERLTKGMRQRGHQVDVFAPNYKEALPEEGVFRFKCIEKKMQGFVVPNMFDKDIRTQFEKGGYDLIHSHHPMGFGYTALYLAKKHNVPIAYTYHTRYEAYLHHLMPNMLSKEKQDTLLYKVATQAVTKHNRIYANRCDLVFAPTEQIQDMLLQEKVKTQIEILPTGLGEQDFVWDVERVAEIRQLMGAEYVFCCVSRLEKEKNFSFMLCALAKLKEQWNKPFKMLIIGGGSQESALRSQAQQLGLQQEVVFLGSVAHEELANYYRASDLFVFSSQSETQGIVLLEGMAAGLPVVAVAGSGVNDIVKNNVNGIKTDLDETHWANAIRTLMESPRLYAALSENAQNTARLYNEDTIAQRAEINYATMLQEVEHAQFRYEIG